MTKYLYILFILVSLSWTCGNTQNTPILKLKIEFDGAKERFYKKYNLWTEVNDSLLINQIVVAIDTSKTLLICPPIRPVMWEIDVFADYGGEKSEHLFKIGSNTFNKLSLQNGGKCYNNTRLIKILMDLVKVEEIGKHSRPMNQADYDRLKKTMSEE